MACSGKQLGESTQCFPTEKGVLLEGCQRRAATPMVPEVLTRRVSLEPQVLGKTKLLTFLSYGWHCQMGKLIMHGWNGLDIWGEDLRMFSEV